MTAGAALRQLQQAQAAMKKVRQALRLARTEPHSIERVLGLGWDSLANTHRLLASIPLAAASDEVMTRQLAVQRYATALLVRLRRLARHEESATEADDDDIDADEESF
jgi:hypothetical protein